jgi:hypothetical protein
LFAGGERPCHFFEKNKNFFFKYQIRNAESPLLNPAPSVWRLMSRFFILFKILFYYYFLKTEFKKQTDGWNKSRSPMSV